MKFRRKYYWKAHFFFLNSVIYKERLQFNCIPLNVEAVIPIAIL